jgi:DNA-binding MltR family transcriptional regulator
MPSKLKRLTKMQPSLNEAWITFNEFLDSTFTQTSSSYDRVVGIMCAEILAQMLESVIITHFVTLDSEERNQLFDNNGQLSSFAAKINIGYALGIYGAEAKNDLNQIRDIRNAFAHTKTHIDFNIPEVLQICSELKILQKLQSFDSSPSRISALSKGKGQFIFATRTFYQYLEGYGTKPWSLDFAELAKLFTPTPPAS